MTMVPSLIATEPPNLSLAAPSAAVSFATCAHAPRSTMDANEEGKTERGGDKGVSIEDCCVHFENFRRTRCENKINAIPRIQTSIAPYRASLEEDVETVPGTIVSRLFETTTKANAEAIATAKRPTAGAGSMGNREE